ncbi:MAG: asparagine synthase (glutamine-hydrolyzing) [Lentisphaeria bacterium]|jgi:asparagine synthase (glutamine-hydrolysing)|nr:asparagine synthase (glutamine-hydrolyzing) [Lentisphaeria bacterium]
MCGLAGIFDLREERVPDAALLERMNARLVHRGPDAEGVDCGPGWGLASRRLAIIGVSDGRMPMTNEDGTLHLVFNGEIYNHRALRERLQQRGHLFRTHADTEVILHLYEERGADLVNDLEGMFAFALVDATRQELLLARDRLGQKPLHYGFTHDGLLVFGSELQALLACPTLPRELETRALADYFGLGYVPAPRSVYRAVRQLPPAHRLTVRRGGEIGSPERWWRLRYAPKQEVSFAEAVARTGELIDRAVERRLEAEVPLGAFLSGGIDSAVVVAHMQRHLDRPVRSFTIGFAEPRYDERSAAAEVARQVGTEHRERLAEPADADLLRRLVRHYGEPYCDSSLLPTALLSRFTREAVTVALSGDGGDELFGGYRRYSFLALHRYLRLVPGPVRRTLAKGMLAVLPAARAGRTALEEVRRSLVAFAQEPLSCFAGFQQILNREAVDSLLAPSAGHYLEDWERFIQAGTARDSVEQFLELDTACYLPDDLHRKVDIASMACGLEVRAPFMDRELQEFVAALPREYKCGVRARKRLLQAHACSLLPAAVGQRPKRGFGVPVAEWLRGGLREQTQALAGDLASWDRRGLLNPDLVAHLVGEHLAGRRNYAFPVWALLCLRLWYEEVDSL